MRDTRHVTAQEVMTDMGEILDELTYCSYRYNRQISPDIRPYKWGVIFSNWAELEARYQEELMEHYEPSDFPRPEDAR